LAAKERSVQGAEKHGQAGRKGEVEGAGESILI